jgi:hypothetical protein
MARTLIVTEINGMDVTHLNATLDILDEPICMNVGVALMPFMEDGYYFLKEDNIDSADGFNEVETGFVKYLYKIRKHNRTKQKLEYTAISGPNALKSRYRVFIAGKIFPIMNISYGSNFTGYVAGLGGSSADCTKIELKDISSNELRLLFGETFGEYKRYGLRYISIDNGKIKIFLPKYTDIGIDYAGLLYDFLTNGNKTKTVATHGEFPDMETYTLATGKTELGKGCWLKKDRTEGSYGNLTFQDGCWYIIENKMEGILAPFAQIYSFYHFIDSRMAPYKHKSRWSIGAKKLVKSLADWLEGQGVFNIPINDDVETILCELNVGICDYAITQFYELFYGKYKDAPLNTLEKAYKFDLQFVQHEQGVIAVPIYAKTSNSTIKKYQAMANQNGVVEYMSGKFENVIPEFDKPWNGKVTDAGFRIDLPMLMLWLDTHKPTSEPFKGKVDANGYLKEEYKKIIRPYEAK